MGIKPKIIHDDLPLISPKSVIPYNVQYAPPNDAVVMFDLTSGIYKFSKQAAENRTIMTGVEFCNVFNNKLYNLCRMKRNLFAKFIVVCLDKRQYVPQSKARTQLKRKKTNDYYPTECTFCDEGMKYPDGRIELIDTMKLARSSRLHTAMSKYLYENMDEVQNVTVIMDCWDTPKLVGSCALDLPSNKIGEADLQLMFWTKYFEDHPIVHITVDGDEIPLCVSYINKYGLPKKQWHWIQHWSPTPLKDYNVIDLVQFYTDLVTNHYFFDSKCITASLIQSNLKGDIFVLYTLMFGTDYTEFTQWTKYVKHKQVWTGLVANSEILDEMFYLWQKSKHHDVWVEHEDEKDWMERSCEIMHVVYRRILSVWLKHDPSTKLSSLASLKAQITTKARPSEPEDMKQVVRELRYTFLYWKNFHVPNEAEPKKIETILDCLMID